jgi:hypothetical protein
VDLQASLIHIQMSCLGSLIHDYIIQGLNLSKLMMLDVVVTVAQELLLQTKPKFLSRIWRLIKLKLFFFFWGKNWTQNSMKQPRNLVFFCDTDEQASMELDLLWSVDEIHQVMI